MHRLLKLIRLPAEERRLLVEAALVLEVVRLGLRLFPFRVLRRLLGRASYPSCRQQRPSVEDVARAVDLMSRHTSGSQTCLTRALALRLLLARRGYPATLHIGVVREGKKQLQAHAWVESGGRVVIGDHELERYVPLMSLQEERV